MRIHLLLPNRWLMVGFIVLVALLVQAVRIRKQCRYAGDH